MAYLEIPDEVRDIVDKIAKGGGISSSHIYRRIFYRGIVGMVHGKERDVISELEFRLVREGER